MDASAQSVSMDFEIETRKIISGDKNSEKGAEEFLPLKRGKNISV